eukprot:scaffold8103_cov85-Cylindrotheca_fusiformis.AAC.3
MGDATTAVEIHSDEATKTKRGSAPRGMLIIEGNELGREQLNKMLLILQQPHQRQKHSGATAAALDETYNERGRSAALVRNAQRAARSNKYFTGCTQRMYATYANPLSLSMQLLRV